MINTPHPILKLPSRAQCEARGAEWTRKTLEEREHIIQLEREDPYRHGFYLSCWHDTDDLLEKKLCVCAFGGNGAGKTFYMARKGVEVMVQQPGSKVLWLHESEKSSILVHQAAVWHYLPKEFRVQISKRSRIRNINYTVANGFSDNRFVLPNSSIGCFATYKQDIADYEGTGWNLICADENFPLAWLKTLLYRLPRCNGKLIWGFTPLHGITPAIRHVIDGAVTEQSLPAKLLKATKTYVADCPPGHMPYIQRSVWDDVGIIYYPYTANPYANPDDHAKLLHGNTETEIMQRGYGYARNTIKAILPKFSAIHIVPPDKIPAAKDCTIRHYADPAGARNMFMIWIKTDRDNRRFVYREWPDHENFGEWAVPSQDANSWDGDPGPAQPSQGFGVIDYKRIILELEGAVWEQTRWNRTNAETVLDRYMDPRSGAAQIVTEDKGGTSIIDLFFEDQFDKERNCIGPCMEFLPAPGVHEDQGIMCINDLLSYNKDERLCPILNEPHLYISSTCKNTIWAAQNYCRHDGEKGACKDPIDCLRYMATSDSEWVDEAAMKPYGGGSYGIVNVR